MCPSDRWRKGWGQATGSGVIIFIDDCYPYLLDAGTRRIDALLPLCTGALDVSRDGKRIAWVTEDEIYAASLSFSILNDRLELAHDTRITSFAAWSPDGQELAFWAYESPGAYGRMAELLIANVDNGVVRSLGSFMIIHSEFSWSPEGNVIAFASSQERDEEIYLIDVNSGELRQLTDNDFRDDAPSWSPDAQQLVFHSTEDGYDELHILAVANGERHQLTHGLYAFDPKWSPDGTQITFLSSHDLINYIYTIKADGTNPRSLTSFRSTEVIGPVWLP